MKIDVISFNEETNVVELDIDEEGRKFLVELGFNAMLMRAVEEFTNERETNQSVL